MHKGLSITALIVFGIFFGLFLFSQVPVTITQDEVSIAVSDAIDETNAQVDEVEIEQLVTQKAVGKLEARQKKRLKFLVSAYFIIWLIFSLYALHLAKMQKPIAQAT